MAKKRSPQNPVEEAMAHEILLALKGVTEPRLEREFPSRGDPVSGRQHSLTAILDAKRQMGQKAEIDKLYPAVKQHLKQYGGLNICSQSDPRYPDGLKAAQSPLRLFYYRGNLELLRRPCVSVIGSRQASPAGLQAAKKTAKALADSQYVVVSGLARGIDTAALEGAIGQGGAVVAVIGTPIDQYYPPENQPLQDEIANHHLLISQVPFYLYRRQSPLARRGWFPKRNVTMSALSQATVIVEAADKSGTLYQARAAIRQKRQLLIYKGCFDQHDWPHRFEARGAIKVDDPYDIIARLKPKTKTKNQNGQPKLAKARRRT